VPHERLWFPAVIAVALSAQSSARAQGAEERPVVSAQQPNQTADFLILAITPEGEKNYKLVQIGDSKIDLGRLNAAIPAAPGSLLGRLGIGERDYDEAAETAECRSACKANTRCRDFVYTRPTENQPVGVCRLKAVVESSFGVMTPVKDANDPAESRVPDKAPAQTAANIVFEDKAPKGGANYGAAAKPTPVTVKFQNPAAGVKVFIRAAETTGQRTWASVEAFDAEGKLVERSGAWIAVGRELDTGHAVAIGGDADRIATVKIDAREPGALVLDGVEFSRTLIALPPVTVAETPVEDPATPPREEIPPPPEPPPILAERFPLPPRAVATEPPPIIDPTPPAIEAPVIATPSAPPARTAPPQRQRGLPLWLALAAITAMFGGAGLYWRGHRARTRARLTTRLVSSGLDRAKVTIESVEGADKSLRFIVRAPANANFELAPKGVPA
jgi:hypothetical protein